RIPVPADGRPWRVTARFGTAYLSATVQAPRREGAEVTALVAVPANGILVRGSVVTATGQPVANADIAVDLVPAAAKLASTPERIALDPFFQHVSTDSRGRYYLFINQPEADSARVE